MTAVAAAMKRWELVIIGAPRTKKNHGSRIQRGRRRYNIPSHQWTSWVRSARIRVDHASEYWPEHFRVMGIGMCPTDEFRLIDELWERYEVPGRLAAKTSRPERLQLNCQALIYRDADRGDAVGYYQGIADLLEKLRILSNDRMIVAWDGSRLLKDPERPRVEIVLTEMATD